MNRPALIVLSLALVGCQTPQAPPPAKPVPLSSVFRLAKLEEIDSAIGQAIAAGKAPGAVVRIESGRAVYQKTFGDKAAKPERSPMTADTIFDAASLTKVIATAPAIALLIEQGKLGLDDRVEKWIPDFKKNGKGAVTIRHLLTHTSGLRPGLSLRPEWSGVASAIEKAKAESLTEQPDNKFIYSDINFILLGEIIQQLTGQRLEDFTRESVFQPLGMKDTVYLPSPNLRYRTAPTKWWNGKMQRGTPNNPICRRTGGVHGHAGMFTTAADLARYCRMILNKGELDGFRFIQPETIRLMTSVQSPSEVESLRGLGWDIESSYSSQRGEIFPIGGFGHLSLIHI